MKFDRLPLLILLAASTSMLRAQGAPAIKAAATDCAALTALALDGITITQATAVQPTDAQRAAGRSPVCRVAGAIGTEIHFVAMLPDTWNSRLMMGGGGGYVGAVDNQALASLNAGYATVGTDAGHTANALTAGWALHNEDRIANFGHRAVHRTAQATKALIRAYYGTPALKSYFFGCSNGGREALMEAQRYPEDFDGIVSVAPALDFAGVATSFVRNVKALYPSADFSAPVLTPQVLQLVERRVLAACDAKDGVADSVMEDPTACDFSLASIAACASNATETECLTSAQRTALETVYAAVTVGSRTVYPGQPFGSEAAPDGWISFITGVTPGAMAATGNRAPTVQAAFGTEFFKYFVYADSAWDYRTYDLARATRDAKHAADVVSAMNPDLSAFKSRGGKLILAHGWSDPALNARSTIGYLDAVQARDASADGYVRLFMMPGVLHCGGGPGCDEVDFYTAIADWVERGVAPARLVASKRGAASSPSLARPVIRTRPLCAYPKHAVNVGSGSTDDEKSFACQ